MPGANVAVPVNANATIANASAALTSAAAQTVLAAKQPTGTTAKSRVTFKTTPEVISIFQCNSGNIVAKLFYIH